MLDVTQPIFSSPMARLFPESIRVAPERLIAVSPRRGSDSADPAVPIPGHAIHRRVTRAHCTPT
jgi:hypothetical protein